MPTCASHGGRSPFVVTQPFRRRPRVITRLTDARLREQSLTGSSLPFVVAAASHSDAVTRRAPLAAQHLADSATRSRAHDNETALARATTPLHLRRHSYTQDDYTRKGLYEGAKSLSASDLSIHWTPPMPSNTTLSRTRLPHERARTTRRAKEQSVLVAHRENIEDEDYDALGRNGDGGWRLETAKTAYRREGNSGCGDSRTLRQPRCLSDDKSNMCAKEQSAANASSAAVSSRMRAADVPASTPARRVDSADLSRLQRCSEQCVLTQRDSIDGRLAACLAASKSATSPSSLDRVTLSSSWPSLPSAAETHMGHDDATKHSSCLIPPPTEDMIGKLVIVLDLDETLVCSRDLVMHIRPGVTELLRVLKNRCEVIVWTASVKEYALRVIRTIDPLNTISHCIFRHVHWCKPGVSVVKDIRLLGRPLNRTLLVDNTPSVFRLNPSNSLLVTDFFGNTTVQTRLWNGAPDAGCLKDNSLYVIANMFRKLFNRVPNPTVTDVMKSICIVPRRVTMDDGNVAVLNTLVDDERDDCFI